MNAPMLVPLSALIVGIIAGNAGVPIWVTVVSGICASGIYLILINLTRNPVKGFKRNWLHYIWIALVFASCGIISYHAAKPYEFDEATEDIIGFTGTLLQTTSPTNGDRAIVDVNSFIRNNGSRILPYNCRMLVRSDAMAWAPGDEIVCRGELKPISDGSNYFSRGYAKHMRNRGIIYEAEIEPAQLQITGHHENMSVRASIVRDKLETFIENTNLRKETQNFLITILLGDRSYLKPETRNLYSDAGISHILALSGMHVAIIASIFMWVLFPINFFGLYRYRMLLTSLMLLAFAFLTGWNPSTVRATLMTLCVITCIFLERKNTAWNSLLLATFIILIFNPMAIFDIGMQLSFICVASLIFFANQLNPISHHEHPVMYRIFGTILTALVATGATWCLTAYYFGTVPVLFLPANLLVLPLLPVYLVISIIYFILVAFGIPASLPALILDNGLEFLDSALQYMTGGKTTAISFSPSEVTVIAWLVFIGAMAWWFNSARTRHGRLACGSLFVIFLASIVFDITKPEQEAFIIQRQATAVTILTKYGKYEELLRIPRRTVSEVACAGKKILVCGGSVDGMSLKGKGGYDYVILSNGAPQTIAEVSSAVEGKIYVIHSSISKEKEAELITESERLGIKTHSLRGEGPILYEQ